MEVEMERERERDKNERYDKSEARGMMSRLL